MKEGDVVKIGPGVIGAGEMGRIERVSHLQPMFGVPGTPELCMYYVRLENGTQAKYTPDLLTKVKAYRSIDDE